MSYHYIPIWEYVKRFFASRAKRQRVFKNGLLDSAAGRVWCHWHIGVSAREIAAPRAHLVALVLGHFDADLVVAAIENVVRRKIGEGILVANFLADALARLLHTLHVHTQTPP